MITRTQQQLLSLALSLTVTVGLLTSIDTLATQPAPDAQIARIAAPASAPAQS